MRWSRRIWRRRRRRRMRRRRRRRRRRKRRRRKGIRRPFKRMTSTKNQFRMKRNGNTTFLSKS